MASFLIISQTAYVLYAYLYYMLIYKAQMLNDGNMAPRFLWAKMWYSTTSELCIFHLVSTLLTTSEFLMGSNKCCKKDGKKEIRYYFMSLFIWASTRCYRNAGTLRECTSHVHKHIHNHIPKRCEHFLREAQEAWSPGRTSCWRVPVDDEMSSLKKKQS